MVATFHETFAPSPNPNWRTNLENNETSIKNVKNVRSNKLIEIAVSLIVLI